MDEVSQPIQETPNDWYLAKLLQLVGAVTLLAFGAALMPSNWIVEIAEELGFEPFPDSPLTFYLARHLSLLYGLVGVFLIILSFDLPRYRPLVWYIAIGTMSFGVLQLLVDWMSELPWWWTIGESTSTFAGGVLIYWVYAKCRVKLS